MQKFQAHHRLNLRLLGPMEATDEHGYSVLPRVRKTRAMLAILALAAPSSVSRTRICALLWDQREQEQARASLRQSLRELHLAFEPLDSSLLESGRDRILLRIDKVLIDTTCVMQSKVSPMEKLRLVQGKFLEDLEGLSKSFDNWILEEREIISTNISKIIGQLSNSQLEQSEIISMMEHLVRIDKTQDSAWKLLMEIYTLRGEKSEAAAAYRRCIAALANTGRNEILAQVKLFFSKIEDLNLDSAYRSVSLQDTYVKKLSSDITQAGTTSIDLDESLPQQVFTPVSKLVLPENVEASDDDSVEWLTHLRDKRQQKTASHSSSLIAAEKIDTKSRFRFGPAITITEFSSDNTINHANFAKSLTQEVARALANFRWFTTITRTTREQQSLLIENDISSRNADYALTGNLQKDEENYILSVRLVDSKITGAIVWASNIVQKQSLSFAAQERFANTVAARLDAELLLIEEERQKRRPSLQQDNAYSLVLQAMPAIYRLDREPFLNAGLLLERAITIDQESALAHSWMAYWNILLFGQGWATTRLQVMTKGGKAAERAMMLDPKDARATTIAGHVKAFLNRQIDEATVLHELALQLNPALALAWHFLGVTHAYAGRLEEAYRCISMCLDLTPTAPHGFFSEAALGIVHLLRHDHEAAVAISRRVTERHPQFTSALKIYLASLGHLGRKTEAIEILKRLLVIEPNFSLQKFRAEAPYQRDQDIKHFVAGLKLAGVT